MPNDKKPDVTGVDILLHPVTSTSDHKVVTTLKSSQRAYIYGLDGQVDSLIATTERKVTENARKVIEAHPIQEQAAYALEILEKIDKAVLGYDDVALPEVGVLISEENDIALSWKLDDNI